MRRALLASCLLAVISGCSLFADEPVESAGSETSSPRAAGTDDSLPPGNYLAIVEVGLGENGYVTVDNYTDVDLSLEGYVLCHEGDCVDLPDAEVQAGQPARIAIGSGRGLEAVAVDGVDIGVFDPADGEVALFAGAADTASNMVSYLQWGSTPHSQTEAAIEAGQWIEGSYAPTSPNATRLYRNSSGLWLFEE